MSQYIRARLGVFIEAERRLLTPLTQLRVQKNDVNAEIGRVVISELGGAVLGEIFSSSSVVRHGKRITKSILDQQRKNQLHIQEKAISDQHESNIQNIRSLLSTVSDEKPRGGKPNSESFVRELEKAQQASKLETRISRTIKTLEGLAIRDFVNTKDLPEPQGEMQLHRRKASIKPYGTLKELETELRSCISTKLESVSPNWWVERVPDDVKKKAEERKSRNEKLWPWNEQRDLHPIFYVDFGD